LPESVAKLIGKPPESTLTYYAPHVAVDVPEGYNKLAVSVSEGKITITAGIADPIKLNALAIV